MLDLSSYELPVYLSVMDPFIGTIVMFIFEQVATVPPKNYTIKINQLNTINNSLAINVEMGMTVYRFQINLPLNNMNSSVPHVNISTTKKDIIGRITTSFSDCHHTYI